MCCISELLAAGLANLSAMLFVSALTPGSRQSAKEKHTAEALPS